MNNNLLQVKIKQRANKLASFDYDRFECWQVAEAFNKAQLEFVRRQISGNNTRREGDESTKQLIDDLQVLITEQELTCNAFDSYVETQTLPANYHGFKRLNGMSKKGCCENATMVIYLSEVADVDVNLADENKKPSFAWRETFATLGGNRLRVYTAGEFSLSGVKLTYYRKPRPISFEGCVSIETGASTTDVTCEFKDDIVEVLIDETVAILAGDTENMTQYQRSKTSATANT